MNFGINLNDMLSALGHLTTSMSAAKSPDSSTVDHSIITPTIIALGDIPDSKLDELVQLTQGDPVVLWNLGSKPLSPLLKSTFRNQVIDAPWNTPCFYTKAPILETIFSLCHAIKSWYDLNERNLTFIHCPSGHPSTGIVIACLLKYIGAFDHAAHAYDFYCSKRLKGDPVHNLAPTYRTLFLNVDKIIDNQGYLNPLPKYLKTITVAGLPVEETPCIEVWDVNGVLYSSHQGWRPDSSSTWNAEFGDGFFKVSQNILGDFAVTCRFGGHMANTKDKSTLIFKYQNVTAFLFEEVVELKHGDVDINPQYQDSIDIELFTVHLMFENNPAFLGHHLGGAVSSNKASSGLDNRLPPFPKLGLEAFEAGLDEISKTHAVVPDTKRYSELRGKGCEDRYIPVALQLSNNKAEEAEKLILEMKRRMTDLLVNPSINNNNNDDTAAATPQQQGQQAQSHGIDNISGGSDDSKDWEVVDVKCPVCKIDQPESSDQIISCCSCSIIYHTYCAGVRRIPFGDKTDKDKASRERYVKRHYGSWSCSKCLKKKQQQLENSSQQQEEELSQLTAGRSHHLLTSPDPSASNNKGSLSHPSSRVSYSMTTSGGGVIVTDQIRPITNATGQPMPKIAPGGGPPGAAVAASASITPNGKGNKNNGNSHGTSPPPPSSLSQQQHPMSPNIRTKQDQVAVLVGLLSSAGIGIEELLKMPQEKQRQTILQVIEKKYPGFKLDPSNAAEMKGQLDLATAMQGIIAHARGMQPEPEYRATTSQPYGDANSQRENARAALATPQRYLGQQFIDEQQQMLGGSSGQGQIGEAAAEEFNPRTHMLNLISKKAATGALTLHIGGGGGPGTGGGGGGGGYGDGSGGGGGGGGGDGSGGGGGYSGLYRAGSARELINAIAKSPKGPLSLSIQGSLASTKARDIPEYARYFKMLKAGIDKASVAEKIVADGIVGNRDVAKKLLEINADEPVPLDLFEKLNVLVAISAHPKYEKYFKMLKIGIGKDQVKAKMEEEGLDASMLDKDPIEKITVHDSQGRGGGGAGGGSGGGEPDDGKVLLSDHPLYSKFFKMLKLGLPKEVVKAKMAQEDLDEAMIDRDPNERVFVNPNIAGGKVARKDHPKYTKYFQLLQVGLSKEEVQEKMKADGLDPTILDKDPNELIQHDEREGSGAKKEDEAEEPVKMIAISQHPAYAKYFKMLKVGLPKENVKLKMEQDGLNPDILDRDPNELIPEKDTKPAAAEEKKAGGEEQKVAISEHSTYLKYFKMLKLGLPKEQVKLKMEQDGLNPAMLEKDPAELIPLQEKKMVAASEHPAYVKYFKMMKVGLPKEQVKLKMEQDGLNSAILDKEPSELIPLEEEVEEEGPKVPAGEHPSYSKFFKMMKVGLPKDAIKAKMQQEGVDPSVLDKDPSELIPLKEKKDDKAKGGAKGLLNLKPKAAAKKKKLHWKALDASKVDANSLWAETVDIDLQWDEEEFNTLFVESVLDMKQPKKPVAKKEAKKQKVVLIDAKRAQNGSIALARIKFSFEDIKMKVLNMDDEGITPDQLKSMREYLPLFEEVNALRAYQGDEDLLGISERYMMVMKDFPTAVKHITIMLYKQQFKPRFIECRSKIAKIQDACDDVRLSARLKKVLKTILKVGNQLNEGEDHKGFTVDSLLKLHTAKALDKKTTILQYVVMLIYRNDEDALKFPEDLKHVTEAARITMEMIMSEKTALQQEFDANFQLLEDIRANNENSNTNAMLDFFVKVDSNCKELERGYEKAKEKFIGVLSYFGEDPSMPSHEFFSTLYRFIREFVTVRESVEKLRKAELRKREQQAIENTPKKPQQSRRHTLAEPAPAPAAAAAIAADPNLSGDSRPGSRSNSNKRQQQQDGGDQGASKGGAVNIAMAEASSITEDGVQRNRPSPAAAGRDPKLVAEKAMKLLSNKTAAEDGDVSSSAGGGAEAAADDDGRSNMLRELMGQRQQKSLLRRKSTFN